MKSLISSSLTQEQEKALSSARQRAVYQAWSKEKEYVQQGKGTRDWSKDQQKEIMETHRVSGFEGHHMRSVSAGKSYQEKMEIASDKNNIQMLEKTKENNEHLKAHMGDTKNRTNWYYDPKNDKIHNFGEGKPKAPEAKNLSNPIYKQEKTEGYTEDNSKKYNYSRNR